MARIINSGLAVLGARLSRLSQAADSPRRVPAFLAGCLLVAALAAPAAATAAATAPEAGGSLDLQAWADSGQVVIVTAVTVPESTKLPATVRIPVPLTATVQWAGEVLGGDLSADPARTYKIVDSPAGGRYAEFTIEQTRTAQVDSVMPALTVTGDKTSSSFEWVQSVAAPSTSFSVRVPGNATDVKIVPKPSAQPQTNSAGEKLYSGDPLTLAAGQKQAVTFSYSTGKAAAAAPAAGSGVDSLVIVLFAALAIAVVALIVVLLRQRRAATASPATPSRQGGSTARTAVPTQPEAPAATSSDDDWGFDDTE